MNISESQDIAVNFLTGKPENKLNWVLDAGLVSLRQVIGENPSNEIRNQFKLDIGSFLNWHALNPYKDEWQNLRVTRNQEEGDKEVTIWKHPSGTLSEERVDGQLVKHLVTTADELNIYSKMYQDMLVKVNDEPDPWACKLEEQMPRVVCGATSPVQEAYRCAKFLFSYGRCS